MNKELRVASVEVGTNISHDVCISHTVFLLCEFPQMWACLVEAMGRICAERGWKDRRRKRFLL